MNYSQNNKQFRTNGLTKSHGFTLIELIITIAIAAIVLAIAVPSFQTVIEKSRIASETDRLFTAIKQARNNAIVTGSFSYLCRADPNVVVNLNNGPFNCVNGNGITGQNDWAGHFFVYTEIPGVMFPDPTGTDYSNVLINSVNATAAQVNQMIQGVSNAPLNGVSITANATGNAQAALRFEPDGSLTNVNGVNVNVRFAVCDRRLAMPEANGRIIDINATGVVRTFSTDITIPTRTCTPM